MLKKLFICYLCTNVTFCLLLWIGSTCWLVGGKGGVQMSLQNKWFFLKYYLLWLLHCYTCWMFQFVCDITQDNKLFYHLTWGMFSTVSVPMSRVDLRVTIEAWPGLHRQVLLSTWPLCAGTGRGRAHWEHCQWPVWTNTPINTSTFN